MRCRRTSDDVDWIVQFRVQQCSGEGIGVGWDSSVRYAQAQQLAVSQQADSPHLTTYTPIFAAVPRDPRFPFKSCRMQMLNTSYMQQ